MKIHRFWLSQLPTGSEFNVDAPELLHQIRDVLQLKPGEKVQLFNQAEEKEAELLVVSKKEIRLRLGKVITPIPKPATTLHLAVSLLKGDSWEEIVRECTPVGIQDIQPLVCDRTIVRELKPAKLQRYQAIAKEATEQSGWQHIPEILPVKKYQDWVEQCSAKHIFLFHHPGTPLAEIDLPLELTLVIGPEGGWTETELVQAKDNGIQLTSLTPATLTARLAPVVACGSVLALSASHKS